MLRRIPLCRRPIKVSSKYYGIEIRPFFERICVQGVLFGCFTVRNRVLVKLNHVSRYEAIVSPICEKFLKVSSKNQGCYFDRLFACVLTLTNSGRVRNHDQTWVTFLTVRVMKIKRQGAKTTGPVSKFYRLSGPLFRWNITLKSLWVLDFNICPRF